MRFILLAISILLAALLAHLVLPWWALAAAAFLIGLLFREGPLQSFAAGFLAAVLLWGGYAAWLNAANGGLLAGRLGQLFGGMNDWAMVLVTALLGGLLAGLAALTGSLLARQTVPVA